MDVGMPKIAKELSAVVVNRFVEQGFYSVGGAAGLHLRVSATGGRFWIIRLKVGKLRRDIGLGSFREVSLAEARKLALEAKRNVANGIDPVEEKKSAKTLLQTAQLKEITFDQAADIVHKEKSKEFKNEKYKAQWISVIRRYASPVIGNMRPADIELIHIKEILTPIWSEKTDTAKKLRGNIETILAWCTVHEYRNGQNPARWQGYLDQVFAKPSKIAPVEHYKAMPIDDMPAFMPRLRQVEGFSARALEFTILTAVRSGEARGATWDEIDLNNKLWIIPAKRMKAGKEHRVPLSDAAITLLNNMPRLADNNLAFPSPRGGALSDMSLTAILRRMKIDAVPHGFRSTFRDWCSERTDYQSEVKEMALAHTISDKTEAAYRRGELLRKRALMMQDWADFINGIKKTAVVIDIAKITA